MSDSRNSGRYLAPALVACAVATGASGAELTIDRLFDAPALAGPTIVGLKISPDGSRVTYLKGKPDDKDRLDLADAQHAVERARLDVAKAEIVSAIQAKEFKLDLGLAEEKSRVQEATLRLNQASSASKIASLKTQRDKSKVEVDITNKRIAQMTVVSPSEGIVTYLMNYSQGWVNARPFKVGDNVWPGSAVAEIPDLNTLHMKAKVEEMDRSRVDLGQQARVVLDPFPERQFAGKRKKRASTFRLWPRLLRS